MLDDKELQRLEKLSCIKLSPEQEANFLQQLDNIIQFLGQLDQIKISKTLDHKDAISLRTLTEDSQEVDNKRLLANVQHPVINNAISIKSVLS